ncbi:DUF2029 domain-containing protein [Candidatus Bathyarchaeota archaeon]|nr:DUF2029 domain-containing protein [Candidatus Bathyarchaeota archaeon]
MDSGTSQDTPSKIDLLRNFLGNHENGRKIFVFSIIFNLIIYWLVFLVFIFRQNGLSSSFVNDFYNTYIDAVENFLVDPSTMYQEEGIPVDQLWVYRNLPSGIFYYLPFYFIPDEFTLNLIVFSLLLFIWNLGSCYLIIKIAKHEWFREMAGGSIFSNPYLLASCYMFAIMHVVEYFHGQTDVICGFFILGGVYFHINKKEPYSYLMWSLAITFKVTSVLFIIMFIFKKDMRKFVNNVYYLAIAQIPNIIMWVMWPRLFTDFISINIDIGAELARLGYGGSAIAGVGSTGTFSVFLFQTFSVPLIAGTLGTMLVAIPLHMFIFSKAGDALSLFDKLMVVSLLIIVCIPTFWAIHVFIFLGANLLWIGSRSKVFGKVSKVMVFIPSISFFLWFINPLNGPLMIAILIATDFLILKRLKLLKQEEMNIKGK